MNNLAVIPARGGSKGIPAKNIVDFGGKPLIAWTIEAAIASRCFAHVVVSTDSEEIAEISHQWGAETPFMRPAHLATDTADSTSVIIHTISWMQQNRDFHPDYVALLQPTSPLRTAKHIQEAFRLIEETSADALVSVTPAKEHPFWIKRISKTGKLENLLPESPPKRRQDLPLFYSLNGAIYIAATQFLLNGGDWQSVDATAYVMPQEVSIDIDTQYDLEIGRCILERIHSRERST